MLFGFLKQTQAQCNADFNYTNKACAGSDLSFSAKDSSLGLQYLWDFGDPFSGILNTDTLQFTRHTFTGSGKYKVTLIVTDTGCTDTQEYTIQIASLPIANFAFNNGCEGLIASFNNISTADSMDSIASWRWKIGSDSSFLKSPTKTFGSTGKLQVRLVAISTLGCTDTVIKTIQVFKKPSATIDDSEICQNGQVEFTADTLYNALSFQWDFGDSSFFSQRQVTHVYNKSGLMRPKLEVLFLGTSCTINVDSILVNAAPDARFTVVSDTLCFLNNKACVVLKNMNQKIKSRTVLFDDGFIDDFTPLNNNTVCHSYTDTGGGLYGITVELIDSSNCIASITQNNAILIHPILKPEFNFTAGSGCFKTPVSITNTSYRKPNYIQKFKWEFGDGNVDTTQWNNVKYTYNADGLFNIKLTLTDKFGCVESTTASQAVQNTNFIVDGRIDSMVGICRNNNWVYFRQTPVSGASIAWNLGTGVQQNSFAFAYHYPMPGTFYPFVTVSKNGCDSSIGLDSVVVHGPVAFIGSIANRYQCQIKDTVYFTNNSSQYLNQGLSVYWDAGDAFGPSCTTNTKLGINTGQNCRYSRDSLGYKHFYSPGNEGCYYAKLLVVDTSIGCTDSTWAALPLTKPVAKGKFFASDSTACPGPESWKVLSFNINIPEPTCLKYSWRVMWDSLAAVKTGNFDSNWTINTVSHNYDYNNYAGDSNGMVSIGLIVENGTDTNGNVCRDTGWFHHVVQVYQVNPNFASDYSTSKYYCAGSKIHFFLKDSQQNSNSQFFWDFGDGGSLTTKSQNYVSHIFKNPGTFRVKLTVLGQNGCTVDSSMLVNVGMYSHFVVSGNLKCIGDTFKIQEENRYHNIASSPIGYWRDPVRAANGLEKVWYNLDDGNGFVDIGPNPTIKPKTPGNFYISMISRDSAGCFDTILNYASIKVSGIYAGFTTPGDTLLCAQTIQFTSTATVVDSVSNKQFPGDYITKWEYNFGNNYPQSFVVNPRRYFATGSYTVRQIVNNINGCKDTAYKAITIIGPEPYFNIVSDTIGCAPLKITFENKSKNATSYIWQFNDITNSSFSTKLDTNVSFKYAGYGNFYPRLIGRGSFTRNGAVQVCDDIYPDTSLGFKKTVVVWELPKPAFNWSTNCATGTTQFTNTSTINTAQINSIHWFFGDGDSSTAANPIHQYKDTGTYKIVLKVRSTFGCEDSLVRNIVVSPSPIPNFGYNYNCQGTLTLFKDSTFAYNDRVYLWNWQFGDGSSSAQKNPQKLYAKDTTYQVTLTVTNIAGCTEKITKPILIYSKPKVNFNKNDACDQQKVLLENKSVCKQTIANWKWNFGDGLQSVKWNDTHTYVAIGNYPIKLVVTSIHGCTDSAQKTVVISPNPIAKIQLDTSNLCWKYHNIGFADSSKILFGTTTAAWSLGDLNSNNSKAFKHRYAQHGTYNIQLISTSNAGCADTATETIRVYPMPKPKFFTNDSAQCQRYNRFVYTDLSSIANGTYTLQWQFGDGNTGNSTPISHAFKDTGRYKTLLILNSNHMCKDTVSKNIRVWEMPKSQFSINDSGQCLRGNQFIFTNFSSINKGNLSWNWNYGDGLNDSNKNPSHIYAKDSQYAVYLVATSENFCRDTFKRVVDVFPMPKASFSVNDSTQCLSVNNYIINNTSSIKYGSLNYNWQFGDGNISTNAQPTYSYSKDGAYVIRLTATSPEGCVDSVAKSMLVYPMPLLKWFVNQPNYCINSQGFIFTDSSSIISGNLTRKWNFGDSTFSTANPANKKYLYPGTKKVTLVETSNFGCMDSLLKTVEVYPKPYASFSINDSGQCAKYNQFVFNNTSTISAGSNNYSWNFGDGNTSNSVHPTHKYSKFGIYKVQLNITSNNNCIDSINLAVEVFPMPGSGLFSNQDSQCFLGNNFRFTATDSGNVGIVKYHWELGDSSISSAKNPQHKYNYIGNKTVMLASTSADNCTDTAVRVMVVHPMPNSAFTTNDSAQCGNNQWFIFEDKSTIFSGTLQRKWVFEDSISALPLVGRQFGLDSFHAISIIQTSNYGCRDTLSKNIEVYSVPKPIFSINNMEQCLRQNAYIFTNLTTIKKGSFSTHWNMGDGNNFDSLNVHYKYKKYGTFSVVLKAVSENQCTDTIVQQVRVNPMPLAAFSVNDTGQCINNHLFLFAYNSKIDTGVLTHIWKFGDGNTDTNFNASKQYILDTTYWVTLVETSDKNCMDSISTQVDLYPKPQVNFTINDSLQCLRQNNFNYINLSKIKYGSLSYNWTFGDGNVATTMDANHVYSNFGNYNTKLTATSNLACVDTLTVPVIVGAMPKVQFKVNDDGQCLNTQQFDFTNNSSLGAGTMNANWHFGDAGTAQTWDAMHKYTANGVYRPKLIVTTNYLCMDSVDMEVRVFPNANAQFTTNDSDQCQNQQNYIFTDVSTVTPGKIASIRWDLGNGQTDISPTVKAYYSKSGFYNVKIHTTTDSGCMDSFAHAVRVYPKPAAWFTVNDSAQCLFQNNYVFDDVSFDSVGVNIYKWNINNEAVQLTKQANYIFSSFGYKNITLISTSLRGCSDTIKRVVYVKPMPDAKFEKLKDYYCELTGPYTLLTNTPGGYFTGKNIISNDYYPVQLWTDTVRHHVTVNACTDSSQQITKVYPGPKVNLGNDTTLCKYEILELKINSWQSTYLWDNGSTLDTRKITKPGQYYVTVTNICGVKSDTIGVQYRDINCRFFLPNVFTPNRDNLNDLFAPIVYDLQEMDYSIYNRWGEEIFRGKLGESGWDGTYQGEIAPSGTYVITVRYMYDLGYRKVRETASAPFDLIR